ncbi:hypothetical protein IC800_08610 [Acinetobacter seifertii]|uniref:hypothetical protein n=2 Tax=Acinetobacter seifertii TaxID=1530123 RepID=UPI001250C2B2|nr:hypothetical protein [Acinetobacter seifertii]QNW96236.1 hypothetical protein IC800_08610 [Acinetobacter seifertii]QNX03399.1 hypothetical protein IC798_09045 [Acinetobacter seifertii]
MKRYLLLTFIIVSNGCMAYSDIPSPQTSCERISIQAEKFMERRQAGVALNDEKEVLRKFREIHKFKSESSKSAFETVLDKILMEVNNENIKESDFEKEMIISGYRQRILYKCLSDELLDKPI